jgi:hypothetical protein
LGRTFIRLGKFLLQFHNALNNKNVPIQISVGKRNQEANGFSHPHETNKSYENGQRV